jgi:ATP-dependent Lon protease
VTIVQRIEQVPPKNQIQVRFLLVIPYWCFTQCHPVPPSATQFQAVPKPACPLAWRVFCCLLQLNNEERFINVPEQGGGGLIPDGRLNPGVLHTVAMGASGMPGICRMEVQAIAGGGKLSVSGSLAKEPVRVAFDYFKANASRVSASIHPTEKDFHLHLVELQNAGLPEFITLASLVVLCSSALGKPVQAQMVIMGDMSLGGTITKARNLADSLQVAFDAGAKRILLPMSSVTDIPSVPGELFAKFQTSFYSEPVDAVFKALGVE